MQPPRGSFLKKLDEFMKRFGTFHESKSKQKKIDYIKAEIQKCDMGELTVMNGNLKCSERYITNKIGTAAVGAFNKKFLNPYKSWSENSVALNGPHGEGTSDPGNCQTYNYGGIMVSNVKSGSSTLVRVSTCHGEPRAIYEEFVIE